MDALSELTTHLDQSMWARILFTITHFVTFFIYITTARKGDLLSIVHGMRYTT